MPALFLDLQIISGASLASPKDYSIGGLIEVEGQLGWLGKGEPKLNQIR